MLFDVVRKSLSGHSDSVFIHPVGADSHYATETAGPEFEILIERIFKRYRISVSKFYDFAFGLGIEIAVNPAFNGLFVIFHIILCVSILLSYKFRNFLHYCVRISYFCRCENGFHSIHT